MPPLRVAIVGSGIAGLCLAARLVQLNSDAIHVDIYESAPASLEVGAGLTLWGRVCEVLRYMDLEDACTRQSVIVASSRGADATDGMRLRGFRDDTDYGKLPFRDAWSLHRTDLIAILTDLVPNSHAHFRKRLVAYQDSNDNDDNDAITLSFADATTATCDVLVGADGLRSVVRAQMMAHDAALAAHVHPRWTGTIAYRALVPVTDISARNPNHRILKGGAVYCGKSQHIVGYPISPTVINLAVNTTNLAHVDSKWPPPGKGLQQDSSHSPSPSPTPTPTTTAQHTQTPSFTPSYRQRSIGSRSLSRTTFRAEVAPCFNGWGEEVVDIIESVDTCMEWPVMDLDPLPFYHQSRVVLIGDAAHAAVPYVGAGAAFAIEDAFLLAHLLHAAATTRTANSHTEQGTYHAPSSDPPDSTTPLSRALATYALLRRPRGNALVRNARLALRSFQYDGPCGDDMEGNVEVVSEVFQGAAGVGQWSHQGEGGGEGRTRRKGRYEVEVERMELGEEARGCGVGPVEEMRWGVARVVRECGS